MTGDVHGCASCGVQNPEEPGAALCSVEEELEQLMSDRDLRSATMRQRMEDKLKTAVTFFFSAPVGMHEAASAREAEGRAQSAQLDAPSGLT